jgi:hypothetical protein
MFLRLARMRSDAPWSVRVQATTDEFCIEIALCRLGLTLSPGKQPAGASKGASRGSLIRRAGSYMPSDAL